MFGLGNIVDIKDTVPCNHRHPVTQRWEAQCDTGIKHLLGMMVPSTLNTSEAEAGAYLELKVSLVYTASSRTTRALDTESQTKQTQEN